MIMMLLIIIIILQVIGQCLMIVKAYLPQTETDYSVLRM